MSVNKATIVGRLGGDPEIRYMPDGSPVANINLATTERWKDKKTGQQNERTEWHRIVFFARRAEVAGEYLRKGSQVYVEGSLRTRKWQDQNGQDRYTTEIVGRDLQMLGPAPSAGDQSVQPPQVPDQQQSTSPPPPPPESFPDFPEQF